MTKMKLGHKISMGFGITIVILLVISIESWLSLKKMSNLMYNANEASWLMEQTLESQLDFEQFTISKNDEEYEESVEETEEMNRRGEILRNKLKVQEQKEDIDQILEFRNGWIEDFEHFVEENNKLDDAEAVMVASAKKTVVGTHKAEVKMEELMIEKISTGEPLQSIESQFLKVKQYVLLENYMLNIRVQVLRFMRHKIHDDIQKINTLFEEAYTVASQLRSSHIDEEDRENLDLITDNMRQYQKSFNYFAVETVHQESEYDKIEEESNELVAIAEEVEQDQIIGMEKTMKKTNTIMSILAITGLCIGLLFAVLITNDVTASIKSVIEGLSNGSNSVSVASDQVASSSQSLASGANEQAASLEEISSSLEEITTMTKQSSSNAANANSLMKEAHDKTVAGKEAMDRLSSAIQEIRESADKTSSVVKCIEEIAFQTNLLALNAAVEAARAGEAGKGFAVVAEEVRNLAQRASEAAKDTATLIETSRQSAENGELLSQTTNESILSITESAEKAAILVEEINTASNEQAIGIEQVNTALNQMTEITQLNAAGAEEFASASVDLSSQSDGLRNIISDLVRLVHGDKKKLDGHSGNSQASRTPRNESNIQHVAQYTAVNTQSPDFEENFHFSEEFGRF